MNFLKRIFGKREATEAPVPQQQFLWKDNDEFQEWMETIYPGRGLEFRLALEGHDMRVKSKQVN